MTGNHHDARPCESTEVPSDATHDLRGTDGTGPTDSRRERTTATRRETLRAAGGAAGLAATSGLAGCFSGQARPASPPNSIRLAQVLPPRKLDPIEATDQWTLQVASQVFEGLYTFDRELEPVTVLASGMPTERDPTTYEVGIRDDAHFGNGAAVTATDVKYSLEAPVVEETPRKPLLEPIETVEPLDEATVEVRLSHPFPALLDALSQPIVPKAERADDPEGFGEEEPVGSGPYAPHVVQPGAYVELEAREDYWGEHGPEIDHANFVGNHSGLARTMSLRSGQADVVEDVQPKLWETTGGFPAARVAESESNRYYFLGFNANDSPMADPGTREAVDYVFDADEIVEHFVEPVGERQYGPLPPWMAEAWNMPRTEWRRVPRRKNLEAARRLFEETVDQDASTPTGWYPTVAVPKHDMLREKVGETVVQGLTEAGFRRARVEKYGWEAFREKTTSGSGADYDLFVGAWSGGADPDTFLYPLFHENAEGLTNGTFYQEEAVMEAIARARATATRAERRRLYRRAITALLEARVHLPLFSLHNSFGMKTRVKGFSPHPLARETPSLAGPNGTLTLGER